MIIGQKNGLETFFRDISEEISEAVYSYSFDILKDLYKTLELSLLVIYCKPFSSLKPWNISSHLWNHHLKYTSQLPHIGRRKTVQGFLRLRNTATSQSRFRLPKLWFPSNSDNVTWL